MRDLNVVILSAPDTAGAIGSQIDSNQLISASFQAVFKDTTAAGTVVIEASNDVAPIQYTSPSTFLASNWTAIPSASASVTSGSSVMIMIPYMAYRWIRARYIYTSGGSSTITISMNALSQ
jgi:hypothetical protein